MWNGESKQQNELSFMWVYGCFSFQYATQGLHYVVFAHFEIVYNVWAILPSIAYM